MATMSTATAALPASFDYHITPSRTAEDAASAAHIRRPRTAGGVAAYTAQLSQECGFGATGMNGHRRAESAVRSQFSLRSRAVCTFD